MLRYRGQRVGVMEIYDAWEPGSEPQMWSQNYALIRLMGTWRQSGE